MDTRHIYCVVGNKAQEAHMRRQSAFTLVELLVVIGIIALLISILLPSLNRARDSANTVACASNLRQIGQALFMYAGDHNGSFPYAGGSIGNANGQAWDEALGQRYLSTRRLAPSVLNSCATAAPGGQTHYSPHPRAMPDAWRDDHVKGGRMKPARVGGIPRATEVIVLFDATQLIGVTFQAWDWAHNRADWDAYLLHDADGSNIFFSVTDGSGAKRGALTFNPNSGNNGNPIPGDRLASGRINSDVVGDWGDGNRGRIKWRHAGKTAANFLFADGHCETLKARWRSPGVLEDSGELLQRNVVYGK